MQSREKIEKKLFIMFKILMSLITLKLLSLPQDIFLHILSHDSKKGNGFLIIKIYHSNVLHYFKFSKVRRRLGQERVANIYK